MIKLRLFFSIILIFSSLIYCTNKSESLTPTEAKSIAKEAYIYGFPIVMNYKTLYAYAIDKNSKEYKGDFNEMACEARLYTPADKAVVTPNSDTPYCMFWCDITPEPVVITVPEIEAERYYSFQLIDLYTHNFAYIGTLTTGNSAAKYLIAPVGWDGEKPEDITDIIYCETNLFFTVVRTQLFDENDLENVKEIQNKYLVQTLNEFLGKEAAANTAKVEFPVWNEGDQFTAAGFKYLDLMLKMIPPIKEEKDLLEKFAQLGIGTDKGFDLANFDEEIQKAIEEGVKEGFAEMQKFVKEHSSDPLISAKIFGTREFLFNSAKKNYNQDNPYLLRAVAALRGLYGNSGEEATYPTYIIDSENQPLDASKNNYVIKFEADKLPPVRAFWSITMYDGKTQLLIDNPIDRYLVNSSMMDSFVKGKDGSITIYVQKNSPGKALEANWLPAPDGPFYAVMRLYGPEETALNGEWVNPPMVKN